MLKLITALGPAALVAAPAITTLFTIALWLGSTRPPERWVVGAFRVGSVAANLLAVALGVAVLQGGPIVQDVGSWFAAGPRMMWMVDAQALPLMLLTTVACGLVGHFSVTYLHREPGHARFFVLYGLFQVGMLMVVLAGNLPLLFVGWEVVGVSSALLIGFFHDRTDPVNNGLRAFATYRLCDVGLLLGAFVLHASPWPAPAVSPGVATGAALLLLLAALGKSAQVPAGGWLARAMEGPTPSSAIFYGALSVHLGVYLLIRAEPLLRASPVAAGAVVGVGALTALYGALVGRAQADAKNGLAYATMTQVGLMFVEVGLGFTTLALVHMTGHALLRLWQFLRAPSILHELHIARSAVGDKLPAPSALRLFSLPAGRTLYRLAVHRFYFDEVLDLVLARPLRRLAAGVVRLDARWETLAAGSREKPAPRVLPESPASESP